MNIIINNIANSTNGAYTLIGFAIGAVIGIAFIIIARKW
jgi:hypothetical protein